MASTDNSDIVFVHTVPISATGSRSLSPESFVTSRSPSTADGNAPTHVSDDDDDSDTVSRAGTPPMTHFHEFRDSDDSVTCQWDSCGIVYTHLPSLIEHIHSEHIGVHKSNYTCEWTTCQRRGLSQTSRFALISHIRSHTGEKPFTCARPECDKSFTRSDALAKHMRLQHNMAPPLPGRGGSRKRKRAPEDPDKNLNTPPPPPVSAVQSSFSTFMVEPHPPLVVEDPAAVASTTSVIDPRDFEDLRERPAAARLSPMSPGVGTPPTATVPQEEEDPPITVDALPAHLRARYVAADNQVLGRSPAMVLYLLAKAKHRYAMQQHEQLQEELRVIRAELKKEKEDKELALDNLLRGYFGAQAEHLIEPVPLPPSMLNAMPPVTVSNNSTANLNATHMSGNNYYRVRPET